MPIQEYPLTMVFLRSLLLLLPVLLLAPGQESPSADVEASWVFLVRHAEKASDGTRDPGLTPQGAARAERLAELLARSEVSHLFASEYRRTQDTLGPLSRSSGVEVQVVSAGDAASLAKRLRELPAGSVAVVAGHSNTVPALAASLGWPLDGLEDSRYGPVLPESEYGRLVQLVLLPDRTSGLELHVGEVTEPARSDR